jgi:hypothetical protein
MPFSPIPPATYEVALGLIAQAYTEPTWGHPAHVIVDPATGRICLDLDIASRLLHKLLDD